MTRRHAARLIRAFAPILAFGPAAAAASPLETIDLASAQRGFAVYAELCSACHALKPLTYADLGGLGLGPVQLRALAAARRLPDGRDAAGHPAFRRGRLDDRLPAPYASAEEAAAANGGQVPPDLSRLALTLPGGADAIARILTGYRLPPRGLVMVRGTFYNPAVPGGVLAMPPPLVDGAVAFTDGTRASRPQMAHDVASFLDWAAHPHQAERRRIGVGVVLYLALLAGLAVLLKRRIWSNVDGK